MFEVLKKIFNKNEKKDTFLQNFYDDVELLERYDFKNLCNQCQFNKSCTRTCSNWLKKYDKYKKTFVIIDDNEGIISLIMDLLYELEDEGKINLKEWNILPFTTKHAGIFFLRTLLKKEFFSIDAALIDITYGNILRINNKNIKINGIHLSYFLKKIYNTKFFFYTGNTLNEYIKSQKVIKEFFKKELKKPIEDYVIYKNRVSDEELKDKIQELMKVDNEF